jgi:hypothetical protein
MQRFLNVLLVACLVACSRSQAPQERAAVDQAQTKKAQDAEREKKIQQVEDEITGWNYKSRDGEAEARADIAAGRPKLKVVGLTRKDQSVRERLYQERFGVKMEVVAGCPVSVYLERYVHAYNKVIYDQIAAKFGSEAVGSVEKDAWDIFRASQREANQPPLRMPVSGTPAADAPVAPPPGIAGR